MNARTRNRLFQFGVGSLLLLTFAVALVLGMVMTLAPYVRRAREEARRAQCSNKLRIGVPVRTCDLNAMPDGAGRAPAAASNQEPERAARRH